MDTKIIEYIITIAEEKSLSKAADKLFLSQPALSQRLKILEKELGTPLFVRERSGLSITDAGRIYINGGLSILQIKQDAMQRLSSMNRRNKDQLRFGSATSLALKCIPIFREKYPDIKLVTRHCTSPAAKEALIMGHIDIALLLTSSLEHNMLEYIPLAKDELFLSLPENHSALTREEILQNRFDRIKDDYFILSPSPSFTRDMENDALQMMEIQPQVLCEVNDNFSLRYMLNQNLGNSFLPGYEIQPEDHFQTYSLNPPLTTYIVAAYAKNITLSEPMKYMLHLLLNIFDTQHL